MTRACDARTGNLPELALGTLHGRERAATLSHVERCSRCRTELDELTRVADLLLDLAPAADPPAGFDTGVLERLAGRGRRRPR